MHNGSFSSWKFCVVAGFNKKHVHSMKSVFPGLKLAYWLWDANVKSNINLPVRVLCILTCNTTLFLERWQWVTYSYRPLCGCQLYHSGEHAYSCSWSLFMWDHRLMNWLTSSSKLAIFQLPVRRSYQSLLKMMHEQIKSITKMVGSVLVKTFPTWKWEERAGPGEKSDGETDNRWAYRWWRVCPFSSHKVSLSSKPCTRQQ